MPKVSFIGRIIPPSIGTSAHAPVRYRSAILGLEILIRTRVAGSHVVVEIDSDQYDERIHFEEFFIVATHMARTTVNLLAFASAMGMSVALYSVITPDGRWRKLHFVESALANITTAVSTVSGYLPFPETMKVAEIIFNDQAVFMTLNDLIQAITVYGTAPVNCGRVVDSIGRMIKPVGPKDRIEWAAMHEALNVTRDYQEWITKQSKGPRHARPTFIPAHVGQEIICRTWTLFNRYLEVQETGLC